jgi:predicted Zn-dependent peptidase
VFRIGIGGTRAVTAIVAFAAGSRVERPDENGIAHFLEHLVFKGGQDHPTYREVSTAAEVMGARTNAFTDVDVVAFYVVVRAERLTEAVDLLTDFVGRPRLDPAELEKERQVVIQEIARAHDQPADLADELIERALFGDHPLGRSILGTEERLRCFDRADVAAFRSRTWAGRRGGVFLVGDPAALAGGDQLEALFERLPAIRADDPGEPAPARESRVIVERRDSRQSHLRLGYRPAIDPLDPKARAALSIYVTLLGGSASSRLFDEIRERRGLAYSVRAEAYPTSDVAVLQLSAGLESSRCAEACRRMREIVAELAADGPSEQEVERARSYAAGRRVIAFESTTAVARAALRERIVFGGAVDPDEIIARLDAVTFDEVRKLARAVADEPAIACVGPHEPDEFASVSAV